MFPFPTVRMPKVLWPVGVLSIMRAFHGLPPDFEEWPINYWASVVDAAHELNTKTGGLG